MPRAIYILFGALFTLTASYALGRLLFQRLAIRLYREEERLLATVCGASLLHLMIFAICSAQVAYKGVFLGLGVLIIGAGWYGGAFRKSVAPTLPPLERFWQWLFLAIYLTYALLYLRNAMGPEMSPDGSSYHLGFVARYLRDHGFSRITTNMYANLTQGIEMLYLFAFTFGRHPAAAMVHYCFTISLPLLMLTHARRAGFPAAGVGGALLLLCSPVVGVDGTTAYIDLAVAAVVFALFCLLHIWSEERQPGLLIAIGLVAGYCFACKYTAALGIPLAGAVILYKTRRMKPVLVFAITAAVMIVPWMAKNWILVGNPLSPFFNQFFPNPNTRISFEQEYVVAMRHYGGIKSYWEVPWDVTIFGAKLSGLLGPVFVLTPLGLLALRWPEGRRLVLTGLLFMLPFFTNIGTRFLLPALPFVSLALSMVLIRTRILLPAVLVLHAVLSWPSFLRMYCSPYAWRLQHVPLNVALHTAPEEDFLTRNHYTYVTARMVEDFVTPGEKVFSYSGVADSYTQREVLTAYMSAFNTNLSELIWTALYKDTSPNGRLRFSFPKQPVRRLKLVQTKAGTDQWSISECRILDGPNEIPRTAEWRLSAYPNPWDVQMAFDNTPVTRWRTWQHIYPGMFVEVDLGRERNIDAVLIEKTRDQYQTVVALYGQRETGAWFELSGKGAESEVPRFRGLRRAAMEEMRARGVRYLLVAPSDPGAEDFRLNEVVWGIRLLAERGGTRLYVIEGDAPG